MGFARIDSNDVAVVDRSSATVTGLNVQTGVAVSISGPTVGTGPFFLPNL